MNIAIVDDLQADRELLTRNVDIYMQDKGRAYKLFQFESGEEFLEALLREQFDIVFMDIYLKEMDGIAAAAEFRKRDMDCKLVFLTTSTEFFQQGYTFNPCHYLVKPAKKEDFEQAMKNCRVQRTVEVPFLSVMADGQLLQLDTTKIIYIGFLQRSTNIHMRDRVLAVAEGFGKITKPLMADRRFLLCIKGVLVNMDYIAQLEESVFLLKNGERLQIALRKKKTIISQYRAYLFFCMGKEGVAL